MITVESVDYYCPWCKLIFSQTDEDGVAVCPICKRKREDGFNQISPNQLKCVTCGCTIPYFEGSTIFCPNQCKFIKEIKNVRKRKKDSSIRNKSYR